MFFFPKEAIIRFFEFQFLKTLIDGLEKLGHTTKLLMERGAVVNAIFKNETGIYANADFRKGGDAFGF